MHSSAGVQNAATLADRGNGVHTFRAEKETSRSDVVHTWQQRVQSTSSTPSPVNKRQQGHHTSHEPEPTNYHTTYRVLRNKNVIHLFFHTSSTVFGQVLQKFYVNVRNRSTDAINYSLCCNVITRCKVTQICSVEELNQCISDEWNTSISDWQLTVQ